MIPANELAQLQADANKVLDQTISVQHLTTAPGSYGEAVQTLGAAFTVAALIGKPSEEALQEYADRIGEHFAWQLVIPVGTTLAQGDQVTLPGSIVATVIGPDLVKSYPILNNFVAVAVR